MYHKSIYLAAVTAATVPALLGLWGNASFSQDVPVRVPAVAQLAGDHSNEPSGSATTPSGTSTTVDDHGVDGPTATTTTEPGEDHGTLKSGKSGSGYKAVSATQGGGHEATTLGNSAATVVSATSGNADSPDTSGSSGSGHSGSSGSGSGSSGSGSSGSGSDG